MPVPQDPLDHLMVEHQMVLAVCEAFESEAAGLRGGKELRQEFWRDALEWLRGFVECCHHEKEERLLFPAMVASGFPESPGPIAAMKTQHTEGRELVGELRTAFVGGDGAGVARLAHSYAQFLAEHAAREDNVLYPMARQILSAQSSASLLAELQRFDQDVVGTDNIDRYRRIARHLCEQNGVDFDQLRRPSTEGHCGGS